MLKRGAIGGFKDHLLLFYAKMAFIWTKRAIMLFIVVIGEPYYSPWRSQPLFLRLCDRFQLVYPVIDATFVAAVLYHGQESFIFCYKILYLFYGPVSLSHFRHFSMFTAAPPIWKLPTCCRFFFYCQFGFFSLQFIFWAECYCIGTLHLPPHSLFHYFISHTNALGLFIQVPLLAV